MSTQLASRPAPSWLRDLTDARATYEESLGWPVSLHISRRTVILVVGANLAAIAVPANLGARVHHELTVAMLPAPIIAERQSAHWTFLTQPLPGIRPDVTQALTTLHVRIAPHGATIPLPLTPTTTAPNHLAPHWIDPPTPHRPLPPGTAVIATIRRLIHNDAHLAA